MRTVICQSHGPHAPPWQGECTASVRAWAAARGFDYRFVGDALFEALPDWYRRKTRERPMVAADLGRLLLASELLGDWERVVWLDADVLVWDPAALELPAVPYAFGREVWVHPRDGRLRAHKKVHNALCLFTRGNPFLDFYIHACESLVARAPDPPPHLVGPRLLAPLHNLLQFPLVESVGSLSPFVLRDLADGGGPALELHRRASPVLAAANLCASLVGVDYDGAHLAEDALCAAIRALSRGGVRA